jgi:hypothetical protein
VGNTGLQAGTPGGLITVTYAILHTYTGSSDGIPQHADVGGVGLPVGTALPTESSNPPRWLWAGSVGNPVRLAVGRLDQPI